MRKILLLLMVLSLLTACKNNKDGKLKEDEKTTTREKDDYSTGDEVKKDETKDTKDNSNGGDWSLADTKAFYEKCKTTMSDVENLPDAFCPCFFEKVKAKYNSLKEVDANSTEEEGKQWATECIKEIKGSSNTSNKETTTSNDDNSLNQDNNESDGGGKWPASEVKAFVTNCVKTAEKNGMEYLDAQSYCDCMQYKLEKLYPNINDPRLKTINMQSPLIKKMVNSCLPGN